MIWNMSKVKFRKKEGVRFGFDNNTNYIKTGELCNGGLYVVAERFEVGPSTLCQYTGLPDKDKTQMYENDIVRASGGVHGVIRFGKYGDMKTDYGFYIEWDKSQPYWRNDICYWQDEIKVIGSYIDNTELLGGAN